MIKERMEEIKNTIKEKFILNTVQELLTRIEGGMTIEKR